MSYLPVVPKPKHLLTQTLPSLFREIVSVCHVLFKITIPVIIVVKILEEIGLIPYISAALQPFMHLVGLPESMGLIWATTMLTNIYAGLVIFFQEAGSENLSVAQVTVLSTMLLIAHGLPVELRITQKAGMRLPFGFLLRVVGALVLGMILHHIYQAGSWLQEPVALIWQPQQTDNSLSAWFMLQVKSFGMIIVVISALITLLRLLRWLHIERLMIWLLKPILKLLGIAPQAASLTIIGVTLGLSFGGGLLIKEAEKGHIHPQDCFAALCLLSLCHSIIEDTLLVMTMGADLSGILWARVLFSFIVIAIITRLLKRASNQFKHRYLFIDVSAQAKTPDPQ